MSKKGRYTGKPYQPTLFGKGRGPPLKPEEALQIKIVEWIKMVAPQVQSVHLANEGDRSSVTKIILTRMALWAGAPDLLLLWYPGRIAFAEVKMPGKKLEPHQEAVFKQLEAMRFEIAVLRSIEDARWYLRWLRIPTREGELPVQGLLL